MKILIINYEFPPLGGGAGNASYFIARELARSGHDVQVLTSRFKGLPAEEQKDGFTIIRIPVLRKKLDACTIFEMLTFLFSALIQTHSIQKDFLPDMTLAFFTIPCAPVAYYMKWRWAVPYCTLLRGGDVPGFRGIGRAAAIVHTLIKPLTRFLWKHSRAVIANSHGLAELARKSWNGKVAVIPNGVDTDFFKPADVKKNRDYVRLLFAGRLSEQKGLRPFLTTLKDLHTKHEWRLTIIGDGPLRDELQKLVNGSETLAPRIEFKGWLNKEKLLLEYQQSDIFVLPSLDEGMPNVILEAMACGLPIIATRIAGNEELVKHGENGFLYAIKDTATLSYDLLQLIENREITKQFGTKSVAMTQKCNWEKNTKVISSYLIIRSSSVDKEQSYE